MQRKNLENKMMRLALVVKDMKMEKMGFVMLPKAGFRSKIEWFTCGKYKDLLQKFGTLRTEMGKENLQLWGWVLVR